MKRSLRSLLAAILLVGCIQSSPAQWVQTNGPCGGHVYAFASIGTDLFAGLENGVYRSTNNGDSWTTVNAGIEPGTVQSLAVAGTKLFAGTLNNGVFLSTDNGGTWTAASSGLVKRMIYSLAIMPEGAGGTNMFAGTSGDGVYRSTNSGMTWTPANAGIGA